MLGEEKRSIVNVNLKKYPRQIQHPITNLKMEPLIKLFTTLNCKVFSEKSTILDVSQVLNSPLTTINQMFLTNNKRAISQFFETVVITTKPRF